MTRRPVHSDASGFTLIELILVMGLLSGFLLLLVQTLTSGVELFRHGERSQLFADHAGAATRTIERTFGRLAGPVLYPWQAVAPEARMVVVEQSLGLRDDKDRLATAQVLLASVKVPVSVESDLWRPVLAEEAGLRAVELGRPEEVVLAEMVASRVGRGRARMLLCAWPTDDDGAVLELRRGYFVDEFDAPPFANPVLGPSARTDAASWDGDAVVARTEVVLEGLLHFQVEMQFDGNSPMRRDEAGEFVNPPLTVWDSARGGLFLQGDDEVSEEFPHDIGPWSTDDARDDVFPHWLRITAVVGGDEIATRLARPLAGTDQTMMVIDPEVLPDPDFGRAMIKVDGEWIEYESLDLRRIGRLRRGVRGTRQRDHRGGAPVRVGREIVLYVRLAHGRDA